MGKYLAESHVKVGLVGLDADVEGRVIQRLNAVNADDKGRFDVLRFDSLAACNRAVMERSITAVCIGVESFKPAECVAFIGNIRVTRETVPFCLVGRKSFVDSMPGFEKEWRTRFEHYYKLAVDQPADDFEENVGLVRDLFLADDLKSRALGQYKTTPGKLVKIRAARPYGFWTTLSVGALATLTAGVIATPVLQDYMKGRMAAEKCDPAQAVGRERSGPR